MIHEVDEALRALFVRDVLEGTDVEVRFDAPTKDWASRRNRPALNLFLYDIREAAGERRYGDVPVRDDDGAVVSRRPLSRRFTLSYLVSAWTAKAEDEHRILAGVLGCLVRADELDRTLLTGGLADAGEPVQVTVGAAPKSDKHATDIWPALGGELKPALDVVVTAPLRPEVSVAVAPPVTEPLRLRVPYGETTEETGGWRPRWSAPRHR
ncbi:MAG TPA: DUF4255 domain-containing protein [Frankiaceae bacterium]|nr:DUF4255 domain-containing protein [Frankiaceae bacterium]